MRRHTEVAGIRPATAIITLNLLLIVLLFAAAVLSPAPGDGAREVASELDLTDACVSTGERYVRAAATTDLSAPVQVYPGALSMYLSESLVAPPETGELDRFGRRPS